MLVNLDVANMDYKSVDMTNVPMETLDHCPVCEAKAYTPIADVSNGKLVSCLCKRCGHMFHQRRPTPQWVNKFYQSEWDFKNHQKQRKFEGLRQVARRFVIPSQIRKQMRTYVYEFCQEVLKPGSKVLDVGAGFGRDLLYFKDKGCDTYAIEASEHRANVCKILGMRTLNTPIEQMNESTFGTKFDLVYSNHVLEHIYDPIAFCKSMERVVKPGGHVYIGVPNLLNELLVQQFFFVLHMHCFSIKSLVHLLESNGFTVLRTAEDTQLRILARYDGKGSPKAEPFVHIPTQTKAEPEEYLDPDFVVKRTLGEGFERFHDREYYLGWTGISDNVRYGIQIDALETNSKPAARKVKLRYSGKPELPIRFEPFDGKQLGMWVK